MTIRQVSVRREAGRFAEDKDVARTLRVERILPALEQRQQLILDFTGVANTTQSFIHACIAEALRRGGYSSLDKIVFKGCNRVVQSVVATVVEYSIRAFTLSSMPTPAILVASDVPQADNLGTVRLVSDAVAIGNTTPEDVASATGYSVRHVHYRMHAGRILGFVVVAGRTLVGPTDEAYELLETRPGGARERDLFARAIRSSGVISVLAPDLLGKKEITKAELAQRIEKRARISPVTSARRAQCLLAWRKYILYPQLRLSM